MLTIFTEKLSNGNKVMYKAYRTFSGSLLDLMFSVQYLYILCS